MKFNFLLIILLILTSVAFSNIPPNYQPSKSEQLVNIVLVNATNILKDKYDLKPCGMGSAIPGGSIQGLTICFDTKHPYTKDQLRITLIESALELINQINKSIEIQEFLRNSPVTIKNVEILIYNRN